MKKIINGKKYDTETAKCVGFYENTWDYNNFNYSSTALYLKKTGEFFLMNEWFTGKSIEPISEEEAREWAENYCDGDDYEEIFGEVEE